MWNAKLPVRSLRSFFSGARVPSVRLTFSIGPRMSFDRLGWFWILEKYQTTGHELTLSPVTRLDSGPVRAITLSTWFRRTRPAGRPTGLLRIGSSGRTRNTVERHGLI